MIGRFYKHVFFSLIFFIPTLCLASMSSEFLCEFGRAYYIRGDYRRAVHEFGKACMADPSDGLAKIYYRMAREQLRRQEITKLLDEAQEAKANPEQD